MPHVALKRETWKKLYILKLELKLRSLDEVVQLLLRQYEASK